MSASCPDFAYIRANVPIRDVAAKLGIVLNGRNAHCWRPLQHAHGDADPSIRFDRRRNKGRCFVCDAHAWSTLDLVMMVLGCDVVAAARWITARFIVPPPPSGKHLVQRTETNPRFRIGVSNSNLEIVIHGGVWARLPGSARSVLAVLAAFADPMTRETEVSYRALMRYGGIGSPSTVSKALARLRQWRLLQVVRSGDGEGLRACNRYTLTLDDPKFLSLVNDIYRRNQAEIEAERVLRAEARAIRRRERKAKAPVQVNLSTVGVVREDLTLHSMV